jgi:hypothetical protein
MPVYPGAVAVGTDITARPPHRSVRAELPHTAPASDVGACRRGWRPTHRSWQLRTWNPALSPARLRTLAILLGPRPSLHRLRGAALHWVSHFVRRLHRYYGGVRPLEIVRAGRAALAFTRRTTRSHSLAHSRSRGLPVLVHGISRRAWGLSLRGTARRTRENVPGVLPSIVVDNVGVPIANFRS